MPNRRNIKKDINNVLANVIDECYSEMLTNPNKNLKKVFIDNAYWSFENRFFALST